MRSANGKLLLWFALLTLGISVARLWLQVAGAATTQSGGGGYWLGITWLPPVFGLLLGARLVSDGSRPRWRLAPLWALSLVVVLFGCVALLMKGVDLNDRSDAAYDTLRVRVMMLVGIGALLLLPAMRLWSRAAWWLLLYGAIARVIVVTIAWFAKTRDWNTHYTKFGPAGIERGMADSLVSICVSQFGFWIPVTVFTGLVGATVAAALRRGGPA